MRLASFALLILALAGCATTQQEAARLRLEQRASARDPGPAARGPAKSRDQGPERLAARIPRPIGNRRAAAQPARPSRERSADLGWRRRQGRPPRVSERGARQRLLPQPRAVDCGRRRADVGVHDPAFAGAEHVSVRGGWDRVSPNSYRASRALPKIAIATGAGSRARVGGVIHNASSVPQYGLQVYFYASRLGRLVGAGQPHCPLGAGATAAINIRAVGKAPRGSVTLEAAPTIFG